jgi:hypothetical protein
VAELEEMTDDELQAIVSTAVKDAVEFIDAEITPRRVLSQEMFDGQTRIGVEDGRSSVVRSVIRDTVRAVKPSLMRIFASNDKVVQFEPVGPEDVQTAEMATQCINHIFEQNGAYRLLDDAFHDALVKKCGILKAYYEDNDEQTIHDYTGLDQQAFDFLESQPDIDVLSTVVETKIEVGPEGVDVEVPVIDARIARRKRTGEIKVVSVPSEEFFINRDARSIDDFYVCGHRTEMRVGDLVAMGYDFDEVADLTGLSDATDTRDLEKSARRGFYTNDDDDDPGRDPTMRLVAVTEAFMRVDPFGTGIPSLYRFVLGGGSYKLLSAEPCDRVPFAIFEIQPEPHTFWGTSISDLLMDDQDAATSILRGILDNVAMTNTPRLAITNDVNVDDVLNNEIGAVVRQRVPNSVQALTVPFAAGQTLSALQYVDQMVETKTGVKSDSQLHQDALQSTTALAVQSQMQSAAAQIETMARNLAEGGMKQLFKLLLHLFIHNTDSEKMMRMNNAFQRVDPRSWQADMDMTVNVGLGSGQEDERRAALMQALQMQQQILQTMGPQNPLVSLTQFRNTLSDLLGSSGIKNNERYFKTINEQIEQQMAQQQAQAAQAQQAAMQQQDPAQGLMQIEQMKQQGKAQSEMMKLQLDAQKFQAEQQMKERQMVFEDDLARDKMVQDLAVKVAQILGQYGTAVDSAMVKREQSAARDYDGSIN